MMREIAAALVVVAAMVLAVLDALGVFDRLDGIRR